MKGGEEPGNEAACIRLVLFLVLCSSFLVPRSSFLVPCSLFLVPCLLVPSSNEAACISHTLECCFATKWISVLLFQYSTCVFYNGISLIVECF